jgi:predicted NUDIX family NTP pyrophosphohydrolase
MQTSAGLLLYRRVGERVQVLLGHMGGPYWMRKDEGAWTIPKGELGPDEAPLDAALREFREELGSTPPSGPYLELGTVRQKGGKRVVAWAAAGDLDVSTIVSNVFEIEWPFRSGRMQSFPELDRAAWFDVDEARTKIVAAQADLLDHLLIALASQRR